MRSDPHDALLLANRDTTVVTQGTALAHPMPDPYGASADEEALFNGVGEDPAPTAVAVAPAAPVVPQVKIPWGLIAFMALGYMALAKAR